MIKTENKASNTCTFNADFVCAEYIGLLELAKRGWEFTKYQSIPWGGRFIIWRHDIDYSLNRSLALARMEHVAKVNATYFINPHSGFYNLAEFAQHQIIQQILSLGHDLGLHFDAAFFDISSEKDLDRYVAQEARWLEAIFGRKPVAFSFHDPVAANLACEAEVYGGLVNCYSRRFKAEVGYCSDSNGYWRFRRLRDVLSEATDPCLQVLTHPGWWQESQMPPRKRIFRSAYGRAIATMRHYDVGLREHGRLNHAGAAASLRFLKDLELRHFELCDYLWNQEHFESLFVELWRIHRVQINRLCKTYLRKEWQVPAAELKVFFAEGGVQIDIWEIFNALFGQHWTSVADVDEDEYNELCKICKQLIQGQNISDKSKLKPGCVLLCRLIQNLSTWGWQQSMGYDGVAHPDSFSLQVHNMREQGLKRTVESLDMKMPQQVQHRWIELKEKFAAPKSLSQGAMG